MRLLGLTSLYLLNVSCRSWEVRPGNDREVYAQSPSQGNHCSFGNKRNNHPSPYPFDSMVSSSFATRAPASHAWVFVLIGSNRMAHRTEKEKMLAGELYRAIGPEITADAMRADKLLRAYNATGTDDAARRSMLLHELLGSVGKSVTVRSPFYCDYGYNISLGDEVFLNFGCVFLDVVRIDIGHGCKIGPYVQILSADHPRDPELRKQRLENGRPINIGDNVWIGAGAIILPGVTVGHDAIIGAGSVVTREVPPGVTVVGNPARTK
jgi:maltose O-acetyltransferase